MNPLAVMHALAGQPGLFLLDSSDGSGWSYGGVLPRRTWSGSTLEDWQAFRDEARQLLHRPRSGDVPFSSGLMGALSYDLGLLMEGIASRHPETRPGLPLFSFGQYEAVLAFNTLDGRVTLGGHRDSPAGKMLQEALKATDVPADTAAYPSIAPVSDQDEASYVGMVKKALALIRSGEIYEINCSRRFDAPLCLSSVEEIGLYQRLRALSPVPYGAYWDAGDLKVFSASPEAFLELKDGGVVTRPMKGTRPRGQDAVADARFLLELESSDKEKAELLMVTDLLRNDLGKVCRTGSVKVQSLRRIEAYRSVFQAVSCVQGRLASGRDAFDLIEAAFPGGSVTGCPKHRAMRAIDDLELSRRGYYTGALGYISSGGDMKLNMLIRTILLDRRGAHFSAGGGIVADSDPASEFHETTLKAEGMINAL
ncbi:MAG: anthranilate synthase component I family protein [Candidatus Omnitrophota bacterium]